MTNYSIETLQFQASINRDFNKCILEQMQMESDFIRTSLDSMTIVMENTGNNNNDNKKGIFARIIQFFKDIMDRFIDKVAYLTKKNKEWLEANSEALSKIKYDGLEIEMIPFWISDHRKNINEAKTVISKLTNVIHSKRYDEYKDYDKLVKDVFPHLLDENDNLVVGMKNYYRTGNAKGPIKTVMLRGNELKNRVTKDFIKYCMSYDTECVPALKSLAEAAKKTLSMIDSAILNAEKKEKEAEDQKEKAADSKTNENNNNDNTKKEEEHKKEATKESMCLVENCLYSETELMYCQNFETVFESDQNKAPSATSVQIKDHGSKEDAQKHDTLNSMNTTELAFFKNVATIEQHAVSALMTVLEERYVAYMNAMKSILSARGGNKESAPNNNSNNSNEKK